MDLINNKASDFIDPELEFLNNQHDMNFWLKMEIWFQVKIHTHIKKNSFIIEKKHLQDDACLRFKELKIKKKYASTYFLIELEYDIYLTKYIRILRVTKLERRGIFELQNQIALNNLDLNCVNCQHKKPQIKVYTDTRKVKFMIK